jgi:hypothetical protein
MLYLQATCTAWLYQELTDSWTQQSLEKREKASKYLNMVSAVFLSIQVLTNSFTVL